MEGQDLILDITRNKFEDVCYDLFKKYLPCIEKLLKDADVNKIKINEIILVGGSSRIPKINKIIQDFFNGKIINKSLNPDECMAIGAVIKGEYIKNNEIIKDFIFLDKTNYSFGIETIEGTFTTIISRGMTIPSKKTMLFTNNNDNENKFLVKIFEGEKLLTKDNHLIGKIMFPISPMSSGQQQIEITLDLKLNLDLYITIFDRLAGKNYKIEICHDCQNIIEFGLNDKQENDRIGTLTLSIENKHSRINMNNMNYQNMGGNMNNMNYQNMGVNMNNMKSNEDYLILKNRINQLEIESKNKDERIVKLEEEVKKIKSYFLSEGEELISLVFNSNDQTLKDFKIIAKNSDKFNIIENIICEKYPIFKETFNYFIANGKKICKYHTLKENNIKNNDVIILNALDLCF